jgi:starch phosphorylase
MAGRPRRKQAVVQKRKPAPRRAGKPIGKRIASRPASANGSPARSSNSLQQAILNHLQYTQGRIPELATRNDWYIALATAIRDRLMQNWIRSVQALRRRDVRVVSYLSAEFLMGPHLGNCLINLGLWDAARAAVAELGLKLDELLEQEEEPGLGNGGLGRLAACYMDSLATLEVPAIGYGIRYEFGIFDQEIRDGQQVEITDKWLRFGNPWEIVRPTVAYDVGFGGRTEGWRDEQGRYRVRWLPAQMVKGVAHDTPVPGYRVHTANVLRLWKGEAVESFDFQAFNVGDYYGAVEQKVESENITKVLYPNDEPLQGKRLRLMQQHFFVSCSLQDMIRLHLLRGGRVSTFHESIAIQLNDTHPSIAVAELMRLLVDEHGLEWEAAWAITRRTFAYTNHTLLPEALERWPLPLFGELLPRHLEIIYEINRCFLESVRTRFPGDDDRVRRMSLIDESGPRFVRMAHLACVGSHTTNGVAALHSDLLKRDVLADFCELYPDRFRNVTNGVTPRRWMLLSNPRLAALITEVIGDGWPSRLEREIRKLERFAADDAFQRRWRQVRHENKCDLAGLIRQRTGVQVDPQSLFDMQVKRIHEYKRQHLNLLHVITLYNRMRRERGGRDVPRTVIFGGKAAPGYFMAKLIIRLINAVAAVVNGDAAVAGRLKVVFFPDFNVANAQHLYPGADLSEQVSTAGKEASGTGNMKFALNGALTIGTLDGANIEIESAVGPENFFRFGLTSDEVRARLSGGYAPRELYETIAPLREALDQIESGFFSGGDRSLFRPLVDSLLNHDPFLVLADYASYVDCQERVAEAFLDARRWTRMSILNVARMGGFSSDRSIREYCESIWCVKPVRVEPS